MKKLFKKLFGAITVGALSLAALVPSTAVQRASAAQVQADASRIIQWAESTKWVNEGLEIYAGQWAGGGFRMFFDVSQGKEVELKFKVPVYEENSSNYVTENGNTYSKYILDVIVESFTNTGKAVLRLWGDSGSAAGSTNISAKVTSGDLHAESASSRPNEVAEGLWVKGVMRESSEFYVAFNTTDFFKTYWGTWDTTSSLLDTGANNGSATAAQVKQTLNNTFNPAGNPCESVQVYFRLSANCQNNNCGESTCPSCGSTMKSKLILTEVNGQSLANTNGVVNDTTAPYIAPVKVKNNATLTVGKAYDLEVKTSPRESSTADLYCDYDSDILSYERLTYSAKVVAPSGTEKTYDSLNGIKFLEAGTNKISVTVTDEAGNTYTTPETTVNAAQGFLMTVENVPETGYVGQEITLPAGAATDSQGRNCAVSIKVQDPYTRAVELDGNSFTPTMSGVYTVEYSAQNEDGSEFDKQTFRLAVSATPPAGGSSSNSGGEGSSSSSGGCFGGIESAASVLLCVACGAAAAFVINKRKQN